MIRKPRPRKPIRISGWFELLLRFHAVDRLKALNNLDQDDYMMLGGRMRLEEFDSVTDFYGTLVDGGFVGMPRPLQEYDIINMVYKVDESDEMSVCNLLLIDDSNGKNDHLFDPSYCLQPLTEGSHLVLLTLRGTYIPSKFIG